MNLESFNQLSLVTRFDRSFNLCVSNEVLKGTIATENPATENSDNENDGILQYPSGVSFSFGFTPQMIIRFCEREIIWGEEILNTCAVLMYKKVQKDRIEHPHLDVIPFMVQGCDYKEVYGKG